MDIPSYLIGAIKGAKDAKVKYVVVDELPTVGEEGIIYLVPKDTSGEDNIYNEYMYIEEEWELIGDTQADISGKQDIMQFSTIPTASAENEGKVIQYIGTSTNDYIQGYFYKCIHMVSPGVDTYIWGNVRTQESIMQYTTMPTYITRPSITEYVGKIVQYIGETDSTYTKGYFYTPVSGGYGYNWEQINVQGGIAQYTEMPNVSASDLGRIIQYVGTTNSTYTKGYFYICTTWEGPAGYHWTQINVQPQTDISGKQDTLVSGTNIKTINGNNILGSGNVNIYETITNAEIDEIVNPTPPAPTLQIDLRNYDYDGDITYTSESQEEMTNIENIIEVIQPVAPQSLEGTIINANGDTVIGTYDYITYDEGEGAYDFHFTNDDGYIESFITYTAGINILLTYEDMH